MCVCDREKRLCSFVDTSKHKYRANMATARHRACVRACLYCFVYADEMVLCASLSAQRTNCARCDCVFFFPPSRSDGVGNEENTASKWPIVADALKQTTASNNFPNALMVR